MELSKNSSPTSRIPRALPRKKHLCQVCKNVVSIDDRVLADDKSYHAECFERHRTEEGNTYKLTIKVNGLDEISTEKSLMDSQFLPKSSSNLSIVNDLDSTKVNIENTSRSSISSVSDDEQINSSQKRFDQVVNEFEKMTVSLSDDNKMQHVEKKNNLVSDGMKNKEEDKKNTDQSLVIMKNQEESKNNEKTSELENYVSKKNEKIILNELELNDIDNYKDTKVISEKESAEESELKENTDEKDYPDDFNPFGDEDDTEDDIRDINEMKMNSSKELSKNNNCSSLKEETKEEYPDDLNPFDDEEDLKIQVFQKENNYDDSMNPFADDDEIEQSLPKVNTTNYDDSLNPFAEDDEDDQETLNKKPANDLPSPKLKDNLAQKSSKLNQLNSSFTPENFHKWKSNKKRMAPKPPTENSPAQSMTNSINLGDSSSLASYSNPVTPVLNRRQSITPNGKSYDSITASTPNSISNLSLSINACKSSDSFNQGNSFYSTNANQSSFRSTSSLPRSLKKKKAPCIPIPIRRIVNCSYDDILTELNEMGDRLAENQAAIKAIEEKFEMNNNSTFLTKGKSKKLIFEYFNLITVKCTLAKRQEELMYLRREHKLEEDHAQIEHALRGLMNKTEEERTEKIEEEEADLMRRLVEVIDERNEIVENMMQIDKRNEFDHSVDKLRNLTNVSLLNPILEDFMKNCFSEKILKNENQLNANRITTLSPNHSEKKKGFTLKKIAKVAKFK